MTLINSVTGPIDSSELGVVLPHEHLVSDITPSFATSGDAWVDSLLSGPVTPELAWLLSEYPYNCLDNCRMDDLGAVLDELTGFAQVGGGTVIDLTSPHEGRSPDGLRDLSVKSGVNIVMGSGWYLESAETARMRTASVDELTDDLLADFRQTSCPPGVIGEIGISPGFTPAEERSLRAAAAAQLELHVPLFIHLPGWQRLGHQVLDVVLDQVGVRPGAVVLCHMDPSGHDLGYQQALAARGVYLEFDMIGMPYFYRGGGEGQSPPPEDTARAIVTLADKGWSDSILVSHDMGIKSMLTRNGGNGLRYVSTLFLDRLRRLGAPADAGTLFMEQNPRRLFETAAGHG